MRLIIALLLSAISYSAMAGTNDIQKVKVTGDRVSLRARPDVNSELLDKAMLDDELIYMGQTNGWLAVQAPDTMDLWVSGQYVQDGTVEPARLNVRSGPNQNYSVVCVVSEGDLLTVRDTYNDWIKIAPPPGSRVWISADYSEVVEPPKPEPKPEPEPVIEPEPEPEPAPVAAVPQRTEEELKPLVLVLDKSKKQGEYWEIPGVLRRANPGLYKLVLITEGIEEPICLVRGREEQMERHLNRAMLIKGKKYWAEDVDIPIIQPVKIHLDPILTD